MSTIPRLFVKADLSLGAPLALTSEQANYLFRVLRLKVNDTVRVFNGRDGEWHAIVTEAMRSAGFLRLDEQIIEQADIGDLQLLFAPLKKTCTDFVVEKATELGATLIQPVITKRTQTTTVRVSRLEKIVEEAAEQTERLDIPLVGEPIQLFEALKKWNPERRLIYCDEAGDSPDENWGGKSGRAEPMVEAISAVEDGLAAILIGPEGGFSSEEREFLRQQEFVIPVSLGPRILRAETAAVSALTLWQAIRGDWRPS
ncbi:16S rRNA (uracil(1498)-N(3))-methyltransferase [Hirschia maritima]|uniref:16S rRNA (uracil(1498)-N(3))-methyltransferase n=1 Tax=Hirschia maritima TaxID=1121961 RepID=UPI00037B5244|nr:16S rRNA (uracil(1498)-N(3))-methyltransferase [Hirschia maritima]